MPTLAGNNKQAELLFYAKEKQKHWNCMSFCRGQHSRPRQLSSTACLACHIYSKILLYSCLRSFRSHCGNAADVGMLATDALLRIHNSASLFIDKSAQLGGRLGPFVLVHVICHVDHRHSAAERLTLQTTTVSPTAKIRQCVFASPSRQYHGSFASFSFSVSSHLSLYCSEQPW